MQLFSIGLALQNDDGTLKLDNNGNEIATYTNFDISEYAKVYVGFTDQNRRGNIEPKSNEIDPLRIVARTKDQFPKVRKCILFIVIIYNDSRNPNFNQEKQGISLFIYLL